MDQTASRFLTQPATTNIPWVDSPFFPRLLENSGLDAETRALVQKFARDGYVIVDTELPNKVLDGVLHDLANRYVPTYQPYYADERRLQDGWIFSENIKQVAVGERIMNLLRVLYQREPIPFQTLNFRVGSEQRTHSDTIHFHSIPHLFMAGVWVALEDVDINNGPLHYYPTSQALPVYNMADLGVMASSPTALYDQYWQYEEFASDLMNAKELQRQEIKVERGQALIWSANLFHGGSPIRDRDRTRFSQVTHYFFSDCLYYTPLLSDAGVGRMSLRKIYNLATGQVASHRYNGCLITNPDAYPLQLEGKALSEIPGRIVEYEVPAITQADPRIADLPIKSRIRRLIEKTIG